MPSLSSSQTNMDAASPTKKAKYTHIDGDDSFQERSTAVFSCLDGLEPVRETEPKKTSRRFPHRVPDHVIHPEKWTKYSLEEDGTNEYQAVSGEVANRNIALSFLDDLRKRRASESKGKSTSNEPAAKHDDRKIVFSRDAVKSKEDASKATELSVECQSRVKGKVNVMPEYVVGQTPKKSVKMRVLNCPDASTTAVKERDVGLEHLQERDEPSGSSLRDEDQRDETAEEKVAFNKRKTRGRRAMRKRGAEGVDDSTEIE